MNNDGKFQSNERLFGSFAVLSSPKMHLVVENALGMC